VFVPTSFFLKSFPEIVVEASNYLNQFGSVPRKFLNDYDIFDALGQPLIKLYYFGSLVLDYPDLILRESSQIFKH
jgi:hypothetical protein